MSRAQSSKQTDSNEAFDPTSREPKTAQYATQLGTLSNDGCPPPTAYCLLLTAYCLLPTAYCFLPSAYCFLLSSSPLPPKPGGRPSARAPSPGCMPSTSSIKTRVGPRAAREHCCPRTTGASAGRSGPNQPMMSCAIFISTTQTMAGWFVKRTSTN